MHIFYFLTKYSFEVLSQKVKLSKMQKKKQQQQQQNNESLNFYDWRLLVLAWVA